MNSIRISTNEIEKAQSEGKVQVVIGIVEDFHPMPFSGHDTERFRVGTEKFSYSDYMVTGGFNNTSSHGGPIKFGLPVRITFIPSKFCNVITKLEVGRP